MVAVVVYDLVMTVTTHIDGAVTVITIDRPDVRNAVDAATAHALLAAFDEADAAEETAIIVLTGSAGTFCAGADLKAISEDRGNPVHELDAAEIVDSLGPMGPTRRVLSKPVLAAVEGHAVAGGLELGALVRPADRRYRRNLWSLLQTLGSPVARRRHRPTPETDRAQPRHGSDPHWQTCQW